MTVAMCGKLAKTSRFGRDSTTSVACFFVAPLSAAPDFRLAMLPAQAKCAGTRHVHTLTGQAVQPSKVL